MKSVLISAVCSAVMLAGCATAGTQQRQIEQQEPQGFWNSLVKELTRDPRDAPWDPPPGRQLFEQIPAWDGAAEKICCGHLRECQPHQSPRC